MTQGTLNLFQGDVPLVRRLCKRAAKIVWHNVLHSDSLGVDLHHVEDRLTRHRIPRYRPTFIDGAEDVAGSRFSSMQSKYSP